MPWLMFERRNFINGSDFGSPDVGTEKRDRVCIMEIWCECFGKDRANLKRQDSNEIGAIMARIEDWEKYKGGKYDKLDFKPYGVAKGYLCIAHS